MTLTVGSLFTGIGGIDLGLQRAGMKITYQIEINPYCTAVLARHWPTVARYHDIRTVHHHTHCPRSSCGRCLPTVDVLAGGFPCQPVSVAGLGRGADDERWMWPEYHRLIQQCDPDWVIIENVPGLRHRGLRGVLADLAGSGFDAEWDHLSAASFGAPHIRDRIWVVAHTNRRQLRHQPDTLTRRDRTSVASDDGTTTDVADTESQSVGPGLLPRRADRERRGRLGDGSEAHVTGVDPALVDSGDGGREKQRWTGPILTPLRDAERPDWWIVEPPLGRVAHGVPRRVDRLTALGNAVVPHIVEYIGRRILEALAATRLDCLNIARDCLAKAIEAEAQQ